MNTHVYYSNCPINVKLKHKIARCKMFNKSKKL